MSKGLSLVELLTTLALVAIAGGVISVAYNGISAQAKKVAKDRDQVVLQEVMNAFHLTGGNFKKVYDLEDSEQEAAALTEILQKDASKDGRTQKGIVGNLMAANLVIVPYPRGSATDDNRKRLVLTNVGTVTIASNNTAGNGFIVVPRTDPEAANPATITAGSPTALAVTAATATISAGSRYASGASYVWQDGAGVSGPSGGNSSTTGTSVHVANATGLVIAGSFTGDDGAGNFTDGSYSSGFYNITISRPSGSPDPLSQNDISTVNVSYKGNPVSGVTYTGGNGSPSLTFRVAMTNITDNKIIMTNPNVIEVTVTPNPTSSTASKAGSGAAGVVGGPYARADNFNYTTALKSTGVFAANVNTWLGTTSGAIAAASGVAVTPTFFQYAGGNGTTAASVTFTVSRADGGQLAAATDVILTGATGTLSSGNVTFTLTPSTIPAYLPTIAPPYNLSFTANANSAVLSGSTTASWTVNATQVNLPQPKFTPNNFAFTDIMGKFATTTPAPYITIDQNLGSIPTSFVVAPSAANVTTPTPLSWNNPKSQIRNQ